MKVLIPQDITEAGKDYLSANGIDYIIGSGATEEIICKEVVDCDAILARTAPFTKKVIDCGNKLKVIGRHGIGVDNIDVDYCEEKGIWVTNAPTSNAISVAEHTIFLMLSCARNAYIVDSEFRAGNFEIRNKAKGMDLEGKTLGLIGLGRIGQMVAKKAIFGFGMKVIGFDPYVNKETLFEGITLANNIDEVYAAGDFVSLHLPATKETKNSVTMEKLKLMKKGAFLINAARGEVVLEADLIEALENGIIRGAGLDVFGQEPPVDNKLVAMKNVIATPHNAALTQESMDRMGLHAAIGIVEVLSGKKPQWPVNNPKV